MQGFSPHNVSVVKTTTTKVTKITRSESPSPGPKQQGSISIVGGDTSEPVRCSGDGMPNSTGLFVFQVHHLAIEMRNCSRFALANSHQINSDCLLCAIDLVDIFVVFIVHTLSNYDPIYLFQVMIKN